MKTLKPDDSFGFRVNFEEKPPTRRGILSTVASVYDPLGIASPIVVTAKLIFQQSCSSGDWDTPITGELLKQWNDWVEGIRQLSGYRIPRHIGTDITWNQQRSLHIFCDGSEQAYGAAAYTRCEQSNNDIWTNLVMAKTRLVPRKSSTVKTIPRIELNAARLAVQLYLIIKKQVFIQFHEIVFWSDSTAVLSYLNNTSSRFQRFVSHRIEFICEHSEVSQWRYIPSELNIADILTKGYSVSEFQSNENWKLGPSFLKEDKCKWPCASKLQVLPLAELEVKKEVRAFDASVRENFHSVDKLLTSTNNWKKLLARVAVFRRFFLWVKDKKPQTPINSDEIEVAERAIWLFLQARHFSKEITSLKNESPLPLQSPIRKLKPFLDGEGLLRVGGRLQNAEIPFNARHQILLPKKDRIVNNLVFEYHKREGHMGRLHILNKLRTAYWILGGISSVRSVIGPCILCRKINSRPSEQIMASLPLERVTSGGPPFSSVGIDYFGPFKVICKRSEVKRYGVVFSCLASRAIHLEVAASLDTDAFFNAFQHFRARRGSPKVVYSDNGTNLVAGSHVLKEELQKWQDSNLGKQMRDQGIDWHFNPPSASHFGGIYEREIRTVRKVLTAVLGEQYLKVSLSDDSLNTLMCEVEEILNNRPLTPLTDDPNDPEPLTPNHLLRLNSSIPFPPCIAESSQLYGRNRWRQVQYLANLFWSRWTKEYLPLLQNSQKWLKEQRSYQEGDLVLVTDQLLPRNQWCLGRIVKICQSHDGHVRKVIVKVSRCKRGRNLEIGTTELERPISKLIYLRNESELQG